MFQFYAKPFGRFMAIGVTVVSQIIGYPWLSFGIREKRTSAGNIERHGRGG